MNRNVEMVQLAALQRKSVDERLAIAAALRHSAWQLRRAVIALRHPDWSALDIEDAVRTAFRNPHD